MSKRRTDDRQPKAIANLRSHQVTASAVPSGYGPSSLISAYALDTSRGAGETVAIVDAYDNPNAEADLATYRAQYGLTACTSASGCFRKLNQTGGATMPAANASWSSEIDLDLDMVSAICPKCSIMLMEANSTSLNDLGTAVDTAVSLGAKFVSNSYGGSDTTSYSSHYDHKGVVITVSSGDTGDQVEFPASQNTVTAVGGTTLSAASNSRGWTETAWSSGGSGCSAVVSIPSFQTSALTGCSTRSVADVSAVANPATGVAVYDGYHNNSWQVYGGTSAASPIIAAVYALAGVPGSSDYPNSYPYRSGVSLNDVTSGSTGFCFWAKSCTAGVGYDGPTGMGTPNGLSAFLPPGAVVSPTPTQSVTPTPAATVTPTPTATPKPTVTPTPTASPTPTPTPTCKFWFFGICVFH